MIKFLLTFIVGLAFFAMVPANVIPAALIPMHTEIATFMLPYIQQVKEFFFTPTV